MFAELVVNIEAPLTGTFHYEVPPDLETRLQPGHLVEVEFGRRLAQGIVVALGATSPVEQTKPIIALVDDEPVLRPWQIELGRWLQDQYLAPLNACLRLMLPPGLTRWADITVDLAPDWDGRGRLTPLQEQIVALLRQKGDRRGRQLARALPGTSWRTAVNQLANRGILRKASVLDPPRLRPRQVRTAELIASPARARRALAVLGRANKQADILFHLLELADPLPAEADVLAATGARQHHLAALAEAGLVRREPASAQEADGDGAASWETAPNVSLAVTPEEAFVAALQRKGAEAYYQVVTLLSRAAQPVPVSDLYADSGARLNHLRRLARADVIRLGAADVWRDPLADRDFTPATAPQLTTDQARVWGRVKMTMMAAAEQAAAGAAGAPPAMAGEDAGLDDRPLLLHGVTGSGKTEIYMRAIDYALAQEQTAIVLVPEIALTPQTVRRFAARFPGRVAVLHSRLSDGERYDTWRRARQKLFDIVIGPRSALFTPLPDLGVIVVDEEHDASYKQSAPVPPPYYHAREAAVALARLVHATVILGSATPDLVSYHLARGGRYRLLELPRRVMGHRQRIASQARRLAVESAYRQAADDPDEAVTIPLPPIQLVDLRQELRAGNRSIFSRALVAAMNDTLDRGEQAILFLNRRGTATFVLCRDCGHVLRCPRCDMPLTYHRPRMMLICHHCGRREPPHTMCPACGSERIRYFGLGTEEVENRVGRQWPGARIVRWDRDTTAGRHSHDQLLASFINREADVLVGTQMIAKGLDLPLVTLVGVISADVALGLPDYRTGERAFQVLAQVAGRAGRGLRGGRVIVQTYRPEHYAIQAAAEHDYASFYVAEIQFRTQHMLPPFRRLARLVWVDPNNARGQQAAHRLATGLRRQVRELALRATEILGPVPPFFNRIDGRYRWQIIVRSPDPTRLLQSFPVPAGWEVDIDPVSTL